jgi:hypothetical protein
MQVADEPHFVIEVTPGALYNAGSGLIVCLA